ncbi:MAG: amidase [Gammaproteobacteria bacterium]|nr:amidase [Gammaproteobacteria bacterium]
MTELYYLSATELKQQYRTGQTKPSEVMRAYINRYHQVNEKVNAFSFTFFDDALKQAELADLEVLSANTKPLTGLAVAIKDETYISGQITTNGCALLTEDVATSTDPVAKRLLENGGIVHGRTTTPEFSVSATCWSNLWGISRSPWNPEVTSGGSSGGSAIAVASGMASFANGTDIGGSIRIPAAFCGLYGFKPAHGRVPEIAPYNIDPYCHHGVITRTLEDLKLGYELIKGPEWQDSHSFVPENNSAAKPLSQIKVAVSTDLGFFNVEPDILAALNETVESLQQIGVTVDFVDLDWDEQVINTAKVHQRSHMGQLLLKHWGTPDKFNKLNSYTKWYLEKVKELKASDILEANLHLCEMWEKISPIFQEYDVLLCPTLATTKVPADFDYSKDTIQINGIDVEPNKGWFMTYPFNTLGQCPVLAMPNGMCDNNIPSSLQIVGRPYQDNEVFTIAEQLSKTVAQSFYKTKFPSFGEL